MTKMQWIAEYSQVLTSVFSVFAAAFAAYAAWRVPISAARLAESLRRDGEVRHERRRLKLFVFSTLMQERAFIASSEAVRALNLIDVVFRESQEVREAWADLFLSFDPSNNIPEHAKAERLRKLLKSMAIDLDISDGLRTDDFGRVYYPNAIAQEEKLKQLEREISLRRLQDQLSPTSNIAAPETSIWPPKPS